MNNRYQRNQSLVFIPLNFRFPLSGSDQRILLAEIMLCTSCFLQDHF